jgi:hypothetical protein
VPLRPRVVDPESRPVLHRRLSRAPSAVSFRARTGVLASSFILEAGGFDSPIVRPSGLDYPAHCAASETSLVRAPTLEPHPRPCTAPALTVCCLRSRISSRRLLMFSSADHDDIGLPRHLRRNVHTFASAHFACGRERRDRERAMRCFCTRGRQGPGLELGPVRAAGAHIESFCTTLDLFGINSICLGVGASV